MIDIEDNIFDTEVVGQQERIEKEIQEKLLGDCRRGDIAAVAKAISDGVDIRRAIERETGYTLLHIACDVGNTVMLYMLLSDVSMDVNALSEVAEVGSVRLTPLHIACLRGKKEVVEALLRISTIDVNARNSDGHTPITMLISNNMVGSRKDVVKMLVSHNRINLWKLDKATLRFIRDIIPEEDVKIWLSHWMSAVEAPNQVFLVLVKRNISPIVIRNMLDASSADINAQDQEGNAAIHICIKNDDTAMLEMLLRYRGLNVNLRNNANFSPLELLLDMPLRNQKRMVCALIRHHSFNLREVSASSRIVLFEMMEKENGLSLSGQVVEMIETIKAQEEKELETLNMALVKNDVEAVVSFGKHITLLRFIAIKRFVEENRCSILKIPLLSWKVRLSEDTMWSCTMRDGRLENLSIHGILREIYSSYRGQA